MNMDKYLNTDHLSRDIKRITVRGGAITSIAQVLKEILTIGSTVILARLLTPQDYGMIAMVVAVTGFVGLFKDMGLSMATVQRPEISHEQVSTLFWVNMLVSVVICLITAGVSPLISWYYKEPRLVLITVALASGFIFGGLTIQHQALLRRQMRFKSLVKIELASLVLSIAAAIGAAFAGFGVWSLVVLNVGKQVFLAAGAWIASRWRPSMVFVFRKVWDMLKFGGNLTGFNVINYFSRNLDNLLIGRFFGAQQLGLYAKAYSLLLLPIHQINAPVQSVALPALSRLFGEPERYRHAYLRILEKLTIVSMPGVTFLIVSSDWLIHVVLGPQWGGAAIIFSFLGVVGLVQPVANTTGMLFITQDRTHHQLRWGFVSGSLSMISIVAGLPWGPVGVAASYAISGLVIRTPLLLWYIGRTGPIRTADFYLTCIPAATASIAVAVSLVGMRYWSGIDDPFIGLAASLVLTLVAGLSVLLLIPSGRRALRDLRSIIPMVLSRRGQPAAK
jgi:O-antigen/teichoic acid export membrane protein